MTYVKLLLKRCIFLKFFDYQFSQITIPAFGSISKSLPQHRIKKK